MGSIATTLEFLLDLPLYKTEAPYQVIPSPDYPNINPAHLSNIKLHSRDVLIRDLREEGENFSLDVAGFEILHDEPKNLTFDKLPSLEAYGKETEALLSKHFGAVYVKCWNQTLRRSGGYDSKTVDINDPMLVQTLPRGVHDSTFESSPPVIESYLSEDDKSRYLKPGYRIRIVNTWRPLNDKVEDRPLAMCDYRSVNGNALVATDRIFPHQRQQNYLVQHNKEQRFYYLSNQTPSELTLMVMFDTQANGNARYCPHASFHNPLAPQTAARRRSIETRSTVITEAK
ncbi:uncharacterized protein BDR25DRAFT_35816 [Lindgomyces ingoldianus]|uniref:Uncharacterized protein n=1 Tax=Lindgomyces ingoldianus TaxID=673940 RepID=A0ACB6QSJ8_9PLEO|nr:uncharacterized protein BDR25DRAFT_35816 [Lindgomyces ingoldianus]KAF2469964.1 hypothetical protein BDR25DRAFT_35816 [Lindgomyces ingoldianus]